MKKNHFNFSINKTKICNTMKTLKFLTFFLLLGTITVQAQVGINITNPDSTAILHIHSNENQGILLPIVCSAGRSVRSTPPGMAAEGLLVFDSVDKVYYFFNRSTREWIALNPFQVGAERDTNYTRIGSDDVRLAAPFQNRNVVIGGDTAHPEARLHVKGNIRSDNTIYARYIDIARKIDARAAHIVDSLFSKKIRSISLTTTTANITTADVGTLNAVNINGRIPIGSIVMWDGDSSDIPPCWRIVDSMGGRFPVGAGNVRFPAGTQGISYNPRQIGGLNEVVLTIEQMPRHNHGHGYFRTGFGGSFSRQATGSGSGTFESDFVGGDQPHENRPPFYAVFFIRKYSNDCPS